MTTLAENRNRLWPFLAQVAKFGAVGLVGFAVDVTVFNLLRTTVFDPHLVHAGPIYAKVVSTVLAILANWVGNRYWTFSRDRQSQTLREGIEFFAVSLAGMGIGLLCLWFTHYVLGHTSVLADNISSNVIGLALGAVFRFVLYRYWVFAPSRRAASVVPDGTGARQVATRSNPTVSPSAGA
ncbi:GtrA family protein [Glaciibacter sp. 2TAF33]|uniref:GtrA family protein n=1 Tax=Glaciibacter sp. 2TAF33 TaxID=3233015 RepID=UPI003F9109C7